MSRDASDTPNKPTEECPRTAWRRIAVRSDVPSDVRRATADLIDEVERLRRIAGESESSGEPGCRLGHCETYRTLFEHSLDGALVLEYLPPEGDQPADFRCIGANRAFEAYTGIEQAEIEGRRVRDILPDFDGDWFARYEEVAVTGKPQRFSGHFAALNRHYLVAAFPVKPGIIAVTALDTTDQVKAQDDLRASEGRFRRLFDQVAHGIVCQDRNGHITAANPEAERILGLTADSMQGMTSDAGRWQTLNEDGTPLAGSDHPSMIALRTGEEVRNVTLAVWRPEQEEYRWLQVSAVPCFREGEDQPYQVYSTFSDITDERHTKEALAKEHRLMRTIIDQLPSFVYLKDREGRFLMHNSSLPAGVSAETNLMGKTSLEVFPEPFASMCHQFGQEVLRTGQGIVNREALIHAPDGTERHYLCTKVPLTDSDGDIVGIVGISHDVTDFQALARAMEESEARYRALVQELPIGVFVHRAGRLLYANPAALELFRSRSIEDFVSRPIAAYVDPDDREAIVERSHSIVRSDAPVGEMIARYVRLDGSSFPMATMGIPHSWGGEPAALSIGIDVTERVRAEEGLLASEREKAAILDTISDQVVYKGPDGRIIWANRAFADGAQRDPDELVGQTCPHQGDHRCAACPVEVAIATGRLHSAEVEAGNGSTWAVRAYPVHADDGELAGIVEVARDVTEQQRAAQSLRLSAQRQRLHFDRSPVAVVEWGLDHRVVEWNPAAEALFGYTKQEAVGRHAYFIVPDEIRGHVDANLEALRLGCGGERSTNPNRRKDGSPLMCEWYNTTLVDESGQVIGFASQVLDVTQNAHFDEERRKLEESSQRTQRLESIGVLAGGIAHDFNNILSAIIGYGELAVLDTAEGSSERRRIEQIVQAGGRARDLVKQILTFSRQHDAEMSSVSLQPIVKESMKFLRASLPATIDFDEDIDRRCGRVTVDPTQFHQIVMNLCTNAGYAMREGGGVLEVRLSEVEVDASLAARLDVDGAGTYARLTVSDTGLGMDKETVDRIFEPFFSTKPEGEGTGLGLSTVHGIVRASGGGISVYSEPGVGTTFHVYLPLVSAGEDAQADAPAALPTGAERVMVVDDEPSVVAMAAEALRVLGYEVDEFVDSREALRTFREDPDRYQLVLTDQTMPHFTGTQLLASVKFLRPEIPVVIATGYQPRVESDLAGYSVTPMVLAKPYTIMELAQAVRDSIEAKTTMADDASTKEASTP